MNRNTAPQTPERSSKLSTRAKRTLAALAVVGALTAGGLEFAAQETNNEQQLKQQRKEQQQQEAVKHALKPFAQKMAAKMITLKDAQLPKGATRKITTTPSTPPGEAVIDVSYNWKEGRDREYSHVSVDVPKINGKLDPQKVSRASIYYQESGNNLPLSREISTLYSPDSQDSGREYNGSPAWTASGELYLESEVVHDASKAKTIISSANADFFYLTEALERGK